MFGYSMRGQERENARGRSQPRPVSDENAEDSSDGADAVFDQYSRLHHNQPWRHA